MNIIPGYVFLNIEGIVLTQSINLINHLRHKDIVKGAPDALTRFP